MKDLPCRYVYRIADDGGAVCSLNLCHTEDLSACCESCESYEGPMRGVGDVVARATKAVGIKPCGGCQKRREALNRMTQRLFDKRDTP